MVWNYHDEDKQSGPDEVIINVTGITTPYVLLTEYRIDNEHSNSYALWKKMGSPQNPTADQIADLEKAGQLQKMTSEPATIPAKGKITISTYLPGQGVSLFKLEGKDR